MTSLLQEPIGPAIEPTTGQPSGGFKAWITRLTAFINRPTLPSYTVAKAPSDGRAGQMIFVTNEAGGAVPAFHDGTNWRRVTDRAVIS
jgi:hypothetical protein